MRGGGGAMEVWVVGHFFVSGTTLPRSLQSSGARAREAAE